MTLDELIEALQELRALNPAAGYARVSAPGIYLGRPHYSRGEVRLSDNVTDDEDAEE